MDTETKKYRAYVYGSIQYIAEFHRDPRFVKYVLKGAGEPSKHLWPQHGCCDGRKAGSGREMRARFANPTSRPQEEE